MDEKETEKELEMVANFTEGNCSYIVWQPIKESTPEELEPLYIALGKILFK